MKVNAIKRFGLATMAALLALTAFVLLAMPMQAQAITTRSTDVTTASAGNCLMGLDGTFSSAGKTAVLKKVNDIRKEACDKGVPDPRDPSRKLTSADYVAMKWSTDLEMIAQTRAAEASARESHTRPNGESCFAAYSSNPINTSGETLAWVWSGMLDGIDLWYGEKAAWVAQDSSAVVGHYTAMINPGNTHIGLGAFTPAAGGWTCVAGEYLDSSYYTIDIPEAETGVKGKRRQIIEVPLANVSKLVVSGNTAFKGAASRAYSVKAIARLEGVYGSIEDVELVPLGAISWKSSAPSVVSVTSAGKVTSKKCGAAKITVTSSSVKKSGSVSVKVIPAATALKTITAKKKALKVKWKKPASLATGYQIRYSLKKSMKKSKVATVKGASKGAKTIKRLKAKKKYYVQVRSFAKVGGKVYYSAWSAKKAKKTK